MFKCQFKESFVVNSKVQSIVFVSTQEKDAKEQWDKLLSEKAIVWTKKYVWRQNKNYVGGAW